jgi:hypothetical protein
VPEINQYMFKYTEIAEALVKQAGLHEGKWQVIITFALAAANMGPSPAEVVPGAALAVTSIGLQRAAEESPEALTVDASAVNPSSPPS